MKKLQYVIIFIAFLTGTLGLKAQVTVNADGDLSLPSEKDIRLGDSPNGDWVIEHWDDGLHFGKNWGSTNYGPYKLFIRDDNGYLGIGMRPDGLFQFCRSSSSNYRGILMGNYGNEIQGRYGLYEDRPSAWNGDLLLNKNAGNVGIGTTSPSYKLHVVGDIYTTGSYQGSDIRLKENITELENCFDKLIQLNGINYEISREEVLLDSTGGIPEITVKFTRKQNGFSAQQVQQVFPYLVSEDKEGFLAVDYISFIPMLVEALKEQNIRIELLEEELEKYQTKDIQFKSISVDNSENLNVNSEIQPFLGNNIPNPFDQATEIEFYLPNEISNADFYIYDLQGKQIDKIHIVEREYGIIVIQGSQLMPGMYYYSLIADSQIIGTKQMILTD